MVTFNPLFLSSLPRDAAVIPLPNEDTTPPVTKIYLVICNSPLSINLVCLACTGTFKTTLKKTKKSDTRRTRGTLISINIYMVSIAHAIVYSVGIVLSTF